MTYYDPDRAPEFREWLALGLAEKTRVVATYHSSQRIRALKDHEVMHIVAEDELARGHGPSRSALERLILTGASRHKAVHLIGQVILDHPVWTGDTAQQDQSRKQRELNAAIDSLDHVTKPSRPE